MVEKNENYYRARVYYSIAEFWNGSCRMFNKLADRAYLKDNMGQARTFDKLFWICDKKAKKNNLKARNCMDDVYSFN